MRSFKDSKGQTWDLDIHVRACKEVKGLTGVDLPGLFGDDARGFKELMNDPCQLVDVLWVLVRAQAESRNVSDEVFGRSLGGDSLEAAAEAFTEALVDFFPPKNRELIRKMTQKGKVLLDRKMDLALAKIDALTDEELEALLDREILGESAGASSTTVPASAGSIPTPALSANSS